MTTREAMSVYKDLRVKVHYESDHVWAQVEEYPGCFASGADLDELKENLEEALGMYLADGPEFKAVKIVDFDPEPPVRKVPIRAQLVHA